MSACRAIYFDTSSYHYKSRRTHQAADEKRINEICEMRIREVVEGNKMLEAAADPTLRVCSALRPELA